MAEVFEDDPHVIGSSLYSEDLAPTPPEKRTWTTYNYAALWVGMAHSVLTYMMASSLIEAGMNWKQALFTIAVGNIIVLLPMLANSHGGTKYGLPFPVICRASFGVRGANVPAILRALVACGWFGIQTWIGGEALHQLLDSSWAAWKSVPGNIWICFFVFWFMNIWIIWKGMDAVRWFEGWAAPAVLVVTVILLLYMVKLAGGLGPILNKPGKYEDLTEFIKILPIYLTAQIGFWATLSLNMPDFTRFSKSQKAQVLGQSLGLPTTMTFFAMLGVMITSASEVVYGQAIWDPIKLLSKPEFGHPLVVLVSLVSIAVATLSINVAANVVSPAFDFANLWPEKIDFKIGGTITGILGIVMMPWKLLATAGDYVTKWLVGYSALLGPIAGIMICDYWALRRTKLHVRDLYLHQGLYTYKSGFNPWALVALVVGVVPNLPGFILQLEASRLKFPNVPAYIASFPSQWQGPASVANELYAFSWMVGFSISFAAYYVLMQLFEKANVAADAGRTEAVA